MNNLVGTQSRYSFLVANDKAIPVVEVKFIVSDISYKKEKGSLEPEEKIEDIKLTLNHDSLNGLMEFLSSCQKQIKELENFQLAKKQ